MSSDLWISFIAARLDEEEPPEICGCLDANHWPPCVPQPDADQVRREIAAHRAILAEHGPSRQDVTRCRVCTAIADGRPQRFRAPCPTVRHLAAIWENHPGYQELAP